MKAYCYAYGLPGDMVLLIAEMEDATWEEMKMLSRRINVIMSADFQAGHDLKERRTKFTAPEEAVMSKVRIVGVITKGRKTQDMVGQRLVNIARDYCKTSSPRIALCEYAEEA